MNPLRHPVSCLVLAAALLLGACSTTRRLGEGEVLYTGVHRIRIEADSGVVLSAAAESAARKAMEHGVKKVDVFVKGPGSGRETAIRSLQSAGLEVGSITDVTPQAHNGVRPPKRRRV